MGTKQLTDKGPDGSLFGQSTSDLIAFHGLTPISQRASATLSGDISLFAISGASYVANTTGTVSGILAFNSTVIIQVWDAINEIRDALVAYGIHKGAA